MCTTSHFSYAKLLLLKGEEYRKSKSTEIESADERILLVVYLSGIRRSALLCIDSRRLLAQA